MGSLTQSADGNERRAESGTEQQHLELKLATSHREVESALALVHDSYVEQGLMTPHASGVRLTAYHGLPSTSVLVAVKNGLIVGTLTLVRDSAFGLPIDTIFDISSLRKFPSQVAEISSLAIHRDYRKHKSKVLLPLLKYLYQFGARVLNLGTFIITVNPEHVSFYERVLHFKKIEDRVVEHYEFVNGAPAVGLYFSLPTDKAEALKLAQDRAYLKRIITYFLEEDLNFTFPKGEPSPPHYPKIRRDHADGIQATSPERI